MTTEQSIIENNKLIAEFMGFKKAFVRNNKGIGYDYDLLPGFELIKETETTIESEWCEILMEQDYCMAADLKFDTSYDWLMPVVEKIESLNEVCDFNINYCSVYGHEVYVSNLYKNTFQPYTEKAGDKIEAVYNACLKFIQYYNQKD